ILFKISYFLIRLPIYALSRLPLSWLYTLCGGLAWVAFRIFRYRRHVIIQNFQVVFPEASPEELRDLEDRFITHFADSLAEILKAFTMNRKELRRRFDIQISDEMAEDLRSNRDIFIAGAHVNNWEWAVTTAGD